MWEREDHLAAFVSKWAEKGRARRSCLFLSLNRALNRSLFFRGVNSALGSLVLSVSVSSFQRHPSWCAELWLENTAVYEKCIHLALSPRRCIRYSCHIISLSCLERINYVEARHTARECVRVGAPACMRIIYWWFMNTNKWGRKPVTIHAGRRLLILFVHSMSVSQSVSHAIHLSGTGPLTWLWHLLVSSLKVI